jgi:predicted nucleic acid-binding protein
MKNPKILLICETNFLYSVILAQDRNCGYLLDLASENNIEIAIPEISFLEVRGKIGDRFKRRENKLRDIISFLIVSVRSSSVRSVPLWSISVNHRCPAHG